MVQTPYELEPLSWTPVRVLVITISYYLLVYVVVTVGCQPEFIGTRFLEIHVGVFLITALTFTALALLVFAMFAVLRHPDFAGGGTRRTLGAFTVLLTTTAFAVTLWIANRYLAAPCG